MPRPITFVEKWMKPSLIIWRDDFHRQNVRRFLATAINPKERDRLIAAEPKDPVEPLKNDTDRVDFNLVSCLTDQRLAYKHIALIRTILLGLNQHQKSLQESLEESSSVVAESVRNNIKIFGQLIDRYGTSLEAWYNAVRENECRGQPELFREMGRAILDATNFSDCHIRLAMTATQGTDTPEQASSLYLLLLEVFNAETNLLRPYRSKGRISDM